MSLPQTGQRLGVPSGVRDAIRITLRAANGKHGRRRAGVSELTSYLPSARVMGTAFYPTVAVTPLCGRALLAACVQFKANVSDVIQVDDHLVTSESALLKNLFAFNE